MPGTLTSVVRSTVPSAHGCKNAPSQRPFFPELPGKKALPAAHNQFAIVAPDTRFVFLFIVLVSCSPFLIAL